MISNMLFCCNLNSWCQIRSTFGIEGGVLVGNISNEHAYQGAVSGNGNFWMDISHYKHDHKKYYRPSIGIKIKLNYNYYNHSGDNNLNEITIKETTIPVILKVCVKSISKWVEVEKNGISKSYYLERKLFFISGPQIGFYNTSGLGTQTFSGTNYSLVVGVELYPINELYITIYNQIGMTNIQYSDVSHTFSGL